MSDGKVYGHVVKNSSDSSSNNVDGSAAKQPNTDTELLRDIDSTVKGILDNMGNMSQSAARSSMPGNRKDADKWKPDRKRSSGFKGGFSSGLSGSLDSFLDGIDEALMDSILGSDFKDKLKSSMSGLADQLGVNISEIPNALGKELGNQLVNSDIGKSITGKLKGFADKAMSGLSDAYKEGQSAPNAWEAAKKGFGKGVRSMFDRKDKDSSEDTGKNVQDTPASSPNAQDIQDSVNKFQDVSDVVNQVNGKGGKIFNFPGTAGASNVGQSVALESSGAAASAAGGTAAAGASGTAAAAGGTAAAAGGATAALSGLASTASMACPYILAAVLALQVLESALADLKESAQELFNSIKKSANRYQESRKKNLELQKKRLQDDVNAMIEAPFTILEDAAKKLYDAWDNQIQTITATQGYTKADVQDLMSSYAQRLRDEGLTSYVSGADIVDNLSKVLESGLSGQVAEEFAYLATKLNAAVPTQDFFSYASTYASVAANAIKAGKSQSEAIAYANAEMTTFASNVLYASRQLSGGFSTGLKDAQQLFDYSVQIANASKEGDAAQISGVLTSVSAITGAIAPDLANGIVEAVVKAATGGNSSEIVALRSLAGINASNTEFLKSLAEDPQGIFTALFSNLAKMQNMSNDNFMEVAEGLSSIFGISMDAFARVDFNYLADAVSNMNVSNASLLENMQLLISGQTTTTAEQLRMAQINEYMLEEGLAYVLDNEVARSIQEHMWQEQLAREMQEASYAVELQGSALSFLEGIRNTIDNIMKFMNPLSFLKKVVNVAVTAVQAAALDADIVKLLRLGKVGNGNVQQLYNLTTSNKNLNLVPSIVSLMGGTSLYGASKAALGAFNYLTNFSSFSGGPSLSNLLGVVNRVGVSLKSSPTSKYNWATVPKSALSAINSFSLGSGLSSSYTSSASTADAIQAKSNANFEKFLETMDKAVKDNKTYDEWVSTASAFGIKNFSEALDSYGKSEEELKGAFGQQEASQASQYNHNRQMIEDKFWDESTKFALNAQQPWIDWENLLTSNQKEMIAQLVLANTKLTSIQNKEKELLSAWTSYYVDHTAYSKETLSAYKASEIINSEKKESGDAVLALAQALTSNMIGVQEGFKDPLVQTNVLLAKILIVAEAIMQQNNNTGGISLQDTLTSLVFGGNAKTT